MRQIHRPHLEQTVPVMFSWLHPVLRLIGNLPGQRPFRTPDIGASICAYVLWLSFAAAHFTTGYLPSSLREPRNLKRNLPCDS